MTRRRAFLLDLWIPGLGHVFLRQRARAAVVYVVVLGFCWAVVLAHLSGRVGFAFVPAAIGLGHGSAALSAWAAAPAHDPLASLSMTRGVAAAMAHYALQIALLIGAYAVT